MAKRAAGDVNVSEAIRNYFKDHPNAGPTEAAKEISQQVGKTVSPTYVSNIKSMSKKKKSGRKGKGRRGRPAATAAPAAARRASNNGASRGGVDLATLETVKALVKQVGAETARRLIDLMA